MRKWILSALCAVTILLAGCSLGSEVEKSTEYQEDNPSMFVCVETTTSWEIVYHRETKVMYAVSGGSHNYGTFTLLVDADGNPMVWKESITEEVGK